MKRHLAGLSVLLLAIGVSPGCNDSRVRQPPAAGSYRIVAIGDSITRGTTATPKVMGHANTTDGGWVSRLRDRLASGAPETYEVLNAGIIGDTSEGVLSRLDEDVFALQPNIIILGIGTNDAYGDDLLMQNPWRDYATNAEDYRRAMSEILEALRRKAPSARVYIMGMSTPLRKYWEMSYAAIFIDLPDQVELARRFGRYNEVLRELAREYGHSFVDLPAAWPAGVEQSWRYSADGIHPNDAGYEKIAALVYTTLRADAAKVE